MSGYLEELEQELARPGLHAPVGLLRLFRRALGEISEWRRQIEKRLTPIEDRLLLVDALPGEAKFGALIRVRGDASLYLGNGPGQPLSRLTPTAL